MLRHCAVMTVIMTVLYVWIPMTLVNVLAQIRGALYAGLIGGACVALTVALYFWGTLETKRDRELAARL